MIPWMAPVDAAELQGFEAHQPLADGQPCAGSWSGEHFKDFCLRKALQSQSKNWRGKMTVKYPTNPDSRLKLVTQRHCRGDSRNSWPFILPHRHYCSLLLSLLGQMLWVPLGKQRHLTTEHFRGVFRAGTPLCKARKLLSTIPRANKWLQ